MNFLYKSITLFFIIVIHSSSLQSKKPYIKNQKFNNTDKTVATFNINKKDKKGFSLLHNAVKEKNISKIKQLLEEGADVNNLTRRGKSPLHLISLESGDIEQIISTAKLLIKYGADVNQINYFSYNMFKTALNNAVKLDNYPLVQLLLKHKAEPNIQGGYYDETPLHFAIQNKNSHIARLLIESGMDIKLLHNTDGSALVSAIQRDMYDIVALIINKISIKDYNRLILHATDPGIIKLLIDHGADINAADKLGFTLLMNVTKNNSFKAAAFLLKNGVEVNKRDMFGDTVLSHTYSHLGHDYRKIISLLLQYGANPNILNNSKQPPIYSVLDNGNKAIAEILVAHGAKPFFENKHRTTLHLAARVQSRYIVDAILKQGIDINIQNIDGNTPLHYAARYYCEEKFFNYMVQQGADYTIRNNKKQTAIDYLADSKKTEFFLIFYKRDLKYIKKILKRNCFVLL